MTSTVAIADAFGKQPRAFKAGRYGLGPHTAESIASLGYDVDASVVPMVSSCGSMPSLRTTKRTVSPSRMSSAFSEKAFSVATTPMTRGGSVTTGRAR